ncbi:MAG: lysophospholipid acyltransferase family protein [Candidatus Omnitrophota bacterium]
MCQFLVYKIAQMLALLLPLKRGYAMASFLAKAQFYISKKDRKVVLDNLRVILNSADETELRERAKETFVNFAKYLVDFFRFEKLDEEYLRNNVEVHGTENLDEALKRGRGVIILAAHIGNYELGAAAVAMLGYPISVVALNHKSAMVNKFFIEQRKAMKVSVIPLGAALKKCFYCLKNGEIVAILGDRDFSNRGIKINFFGKDAVMPKGVAVLSLRSGAAVIPTFLMRREDDTFGLTFEKPISYSPTEDFDEDTRRFTEKCTAAIEEYVRRCPSQWFMFKRFWE